MAHGSFRASHLAAASQTCKGKAQHQLWVLGLSLVNAAVLGGITAISVWRRAKPSKSGQRKQEMTKKERLEMTKKERLLSLVEECRKLGSLSPAKSFLEKKFPLEFQVGSSSAIWYYLLPHEMVQCMSSARIALTCVSERTRELKCLVFLLGFSDGVHFLDLKLRFWLALQIAREMHREGTVQGTLCFGVMLPTAKRMLRAETEYGTFLLSEKL